MVERLVSQPCVTWIHSSCLFSWRVGWAGRSKVISLTCLAVSAGCRLAPWRSPSGASPGSSHGPRGRAEGEHRSAGLLHVELQKALTITSTTSYWPEPIIRQPRFEGNREIDTHSWRREGQNLIEKKRERNYYEHFGKKYTTTYDAIWQWLKMILTNICRQYKKSLMK